MTTNYNLLDLALQYHDALPARIRHYLSSRGIPDEIVDSHIIGWNGWRITIPIYNKQGEVTFFRLAKDPDDARPAPKMLSSPGASVELYGWDELLKQPKEIIICEGEFDRLVLQAQGFAAVTSTGGAATFRPHWAEAIRKIENVYICFDRDNAGRNGAQVVSLMIPQAKLVELPQEVGEGGDVTDFFVRLGKSKDDFKKLLQDSKPAMEATKPSRPTRKHDLESTQSLLFDRIQRIKTEIPLERILAEYIELRPSGKNLVARCPFHRERTPSFTLYPQSDTYHCFGCAAHGDIISFVQAMENLSFGQALDVLDSLTFNNGKRDQKDNSRSKAA